MFSKACEYAIKASLYIAMKSEGNARVGLQEIAEEIQSPISFTSKILQKLVKSKIIDSQKGPTGGFEIKKSKLQKTSLSEIVAAIDGDSIYMDCALGFAHCNEKKPCPLHFKFKALREELRQMLEHTSLLDLSKDIQKRKTFLK
ncbi:MAG: Rrf2 family transcriptional regulator [Saprospiraceae bacterium]|nr:Rrf2 family transcriptional regulator [Saprospiraceae bacterium]